MCKCCPRKSMRGRYATLHKIRLSDGAVVWQALKPAMANSPAMLTHVERRSTAVVADPNGEWVAEAGGYMYNDLERCHGLLTVYDDLGKIVEPRVSSTATFAPAGATSLGMHYNVWSLATSGDDQFIWGCRRQAGGQARSFYRYNITTGVSDSVRTVGVSADNGGDLDFPMRVLTSSDMPLRQQIWDNGTGGLTWMKVNVSSNNSGRDYRNANLVNPPYPYYEPPDYFLSTYNPFNRSFSSVSPLGRATFGTLGGGKVAEVIMPIDSTGSSTVYIATVPSYPPFHGTVVWKFVPTTDPSRFYNTRTNFVGNHNAISTFGEHRIAVGTNCGRHYMFDGGADFVWGVLETSPLLTDSLTGRIANDDDAIYTFGYSRPPGTQRLCVRKLTADGAAWTTDLGPRGLPVYQAAWDSRVIDGVLVTIGKAVIDGRQYQAWGIDTETGEIAWKTPAVIDGAALDSAIASDGEHLYVLAPGKVCES